MKYLGGLEYLWMIVFIMITAGIAKEHKLFTSLFVYLQTTFKSNRLVVALVSAIGGILPIEGRVTVSAGVLDTICTCEGHSRHKMGTVDYLATHHYYMWSPLEKTVILPIAAFGLTYATWIGMVWPLLLATLIYITSYIYFTVKDTDVLIDTTVPMKMSLITRNALPFFAAIGLYIYTGGVNNATAIFGSLAFYYCFITRTWDWRKLLSFINWQVLITVATAIVLGNYAKTFEPTFKAWVSGGMFDIHTLIGISAVSTIGFLASFFMGSSGKYVAFAVLLAQLFGVEYFLWFFTVDYVGYLLSPTHKCVAVGNRYFGTPLKDYYLAIGGWCLAMLAVASTVFL